MIETVATAASSGPGPAGAAAGGGYGPKANPTRLGDLVDWSISVAPWLELGTHESQCRASDHALDAIIAALTARAAALDQINHPGPDQVLAARSEGWIAIPTATLPQLRPT